MPAHDPIKVLFISTSYPSDRTDWRGVFIRNLLQAMARRPETSLCVWSPPGDMPAGVEYVTTPNERGWLSDLMSRGGIAHALRHGGLRAISVPLRLISLLRGVYVRESAPDIYHINWLQNALPLPHDGRPLLVTVLGTDMQLLKLPLMTFMLRRACRARKVAICPNAEWMVPDLTRRFGDMARVEAVPFGIDPEWYSLQRAPSASPARWLCVSRLTRAKLGPLFEWCEPLFSRGKRELHLFGPMQETIAVPDWVHYHGPATPQQLRDEWFPQACALITLSRHAEGRPQVILEAMAAGLPIVASRLPAHTDLITHREDGWICDDAAGLSHALDVIEEPQLNLAMGQRGRDRVLADIGTWDDCAARYFALYRQLGAWGDR